MQSLPNTDAISTPKTHAPTGANEAAYIVLGNPTDVVVNGGFGADTEWVATPNWSIASGVATKVSGGLISDLTQLEVLTLGNWYLVVFEVTSYTGGTVQVKPGSGTSVTARSALGVYAEIKQCSGATGGTDVIIRGSATFGGSVDNVIVYDLGTDTGAGWQVVDGIQGSYDSAITGGKLEVASSAGVFYQEDITEAGPFQWPEHYAPGVKLYSVKDRPLVILLHAAVATGKINAQVR